jgi:hypothetical protein
MVKLHSKHNIEVSAVEAVDMARRGSLSVNERIAQAIFAELRPDFSASAVYPVVNGRARLVVVVDRGVLVEEFRSWREAVLGSLD